MHPFLPTRTTDRIIGFYTYKDKTVYWGGKRLKCEHKRMRTQCKDCGGSIICEHDRRRNECKDCGGTSICEHDRRRSLCKDCGGASICEHDRRRVHCKDCGGTSICEHDRIRNRCKDCSPSGHLMSIMRSRVRKALKDYNVCNENKQHTMEYVGCYITYLREHLEKKFTEGMSWENIGEWHIDHIKPCDSFNLDIEEERHKCFHYSNLQPLWAQENLEKGAKYDSSKDNRQWDGEKWIDG